LLILIGLLFFLFLGKLIFKNLVKSGLFVSLGVLIFFSHGHLHNLIGALKYHVWRFEFGTDDTLFAIWGILSALALFFLLRTKQDLNRFTKFLNFVSLVLVSY